MFCCCLHCQNSQLARLWCAKEKISMPTSFGRLLLRKTRLVLSLHCASTESRNRRSIHWLSGILLHPKKFSRSRESRKNSKRFLERLTRRISWHRSKWSKYCHRVVQ